MVKEGLLNLIVPKFDAIQFNKGSQGPAGSN